MIAKRQDTIRITYSKHTTSTRPAIEYLFEKKKGRKKKKPFASSMQLVLATI